MDPLTGKKSKSSTENPESMSNDTRLTRGIQAIEASFGSFSLTGSKEKILEELSHFEARNQDLKIIPELEAVIKWHKNLFLQKADYFPRAEQLLDEALGIIGTTQNPILLPWRLRILISLGYVHRARCNYLDADAFLTDALNLAKSHSSLSGFLGEIYSLLSSANLFLHLNSRAKRFSTLEKKIASDRFHDNPGDRFRAASYAFSLINYSRIHRLIDLIHSEHVSDLEEATAIFKQIQHEKGELLARLELIEHQCATNLIDDALDVALFLEKSFLEKGMKPEAIQSGLVAVKVYHRIFNFEQAKKKGAEIAAFAETHRLKSELVMADVYFELGNIHYAINEEQHALKCYRESARLGMVMGVKSIIVRAFNASRIIDKQLASELLTSDLVYEEARFVRNKVERTINPFKESRSKVKIAASTMFLDIVDFSAIMMRSDEDLTVKMVDELIDRICLIVYLHNGYIDKFLGDGVMAIFEHGDRLNLEMALNTVKCGLDILRALKHKNYKLKKNFGIDNNIDVRIGISSGEIYAILLGNYIKTEFTYLGNSVNLASKLEKQAASQMILIDDKTLELVGDRVISTPQSVKIPGMGETVAHRIIRLTRKSERPFSSPSIPPNLINSGLCR
jgi:class 3 adenylate cyclase